MPLRVGRAGEGKILEESERASEEKTGACAPAETLVPCFTIDQRAVARGGARLDKGHGQSFGGLWLGLVGRKLRERAPHTKCWRQGTCTSWLSLFFFRLSSSSSFANVVSREMKDAALRLSSPHGPQRPHAVAMPRVAGSTSFEGSSSSRSLLSSPTLRSPSVLC